MHFDQRTQAALREVGLDIDELQAASAHVVDAVETDAAVLSAFFDEHDVVYSDMDMAHAATDYPEHDVSHCDLTTHAASMRGWLRFESWGAYVEDGRILERTSDGGDGSDDGDGSDGSDRSDGGDPEADEPLVVELSLGPTIHDRVRFAPTREALE